MPRRSKEEGKLPPYDLRASREQHQLTQAETAEILFATQSSVARWEGDGQLPKIYRAYWELYWKHPPAKKKAKSG